MVAWRAGILAILLDGFDEVASQVVASAADVRFMRDARADACRGVRNIVQNTPAGSGLLICGRDHYFDSDGELEQALGLSGRTYSVVRLGEFTEQQASEFLARKGTVAALPDWLPRKPLILGYLAHRGLLKTVLEIDPGKGFGYVWNEFLRLICEREAAAHDRAVMDPLTLRRLLERLSCDVRSTAAGTGPITGRELAEAYQDETGQTAGEGVLMQLQRLPGLTPREQDPSARSFIDEDFLAALQGSAIARFALEGVGGQHKRIWVQPLSRKALAMASFLLTEAGASPETIITRAWASYQANHRRSFESQLAADCILAAVEMARDGSYLDCRGVLLDGGTIHTLDLEELVISNLGIENCVIEELVVGPRISESSLTIKNSIVGRVRGVSAMSALPTHLLQNCTVMEYDDVSTNSAVIRSTLEPPMKALLTILRKLYLQAGSGRKLSALRRGLPSGPVSDAVDEVIRILQSEEVIFVNGEVVQPVRRQTSRIQGILNSTALSSDPIVVKVRDL